MRKAFTNELHKLDKSRFVDIKMLLDFHNRINSTEAFYRDENPETHLCAFYLPIDNKQKKIYLVVHKKSGLWMPPGGHIDIGESPLEAVKRECNEELNFTLTTEPIELYTISIEDIDNPIQKCKRHYSFWYIVNMELKEFNYNKNESENGRWVSFIEAMNMVTFYSYVKPIASLSRYLEL